MIKQMATAEKVPMHRIAQCSPPYMCVCIILGMMYRVHRILWSLQITNFIVRYLIYCNWLWMIKKCLCTLVPSKVLLLYHRWILPSPVYWENWPAEDPFSRNPKMCVKGNKKVEWIDLWECRVFPSSMTISLSDAWSLCTPSSEHIIIAPPARAELGQKPVFYPPPPHRSNVCGNIGEPYKVAY